MAGMSPPGTYRAAGPQTSRATGVSSRTEGTPLASASSGGRPKPSYSERNAKTDALRNASASSGSGTYDRTRMRPPAPEARPNASMSWCGQVRFSPMMSSRASGTASSTRRNAEMRSGTLRRLKTEPT